MILLSILYGLVLTLFATAVGYVLVPDVAWNWKVILGFWMFWTGGHITYEVLAQYIVKFFNKNYGVYRG